MVIEPAEVNVGETVRISVMATNYGAILGSKQIVMQIDGEIITEQSVELWSGESKQVLFEVAPYEAGVHYVSVDGLTSSFITRLGIVVMQRTMGHYWHRRPPEINWELLSVTFDAKSFMVEPITLDRAIIEVAGQREEVGIDLELKYFDYVIYTVPIETIKDVPRGEYELTVSLWSGSEMICSRTDIAKVHWKEKPEEVTQSFGY